MVDQAKVRRESMRWNILLTLNNARPIGAYEATALELRRELDYLADRSLVDLKKEPSGRWFADVTRYGVDIAEYTVDCQPGIARPVKYWA